jgi:GNAT superfamily N-acetyltransferase
MTMATVEVRTARLDEAEALTELALRSKASWGYSAEFMAASRVELTVSAERMAAWDFWVAELGGELAGMIALSQEDGRAAIEDFFVDPRFQKRGVGAALMAVLLATCRERAVTALDVDADPNAEAIYARFGFRTVGRTPSGSIPGRFLPRMELLL